MIPIPPPPTELPTNVVAVVGRVPDRNGERGGVVTKREFQHALVQAAAQAGRRRAPGPGGNGYRKLKNVAIGELLDDAWIRGQAAEMGIGLRPRGVSRELALLRKQAFRNMAQYRRFLSEAHYTRRDVLDRVEIQMLSIRIQERIGFGLSGKARQKAFSRFVSEYEERWRSRTVCAPGFVTVSCSNGPTPT